jgi:predicted Zn-dependent peptidase
MDILIHTLNNGIRLVHMQVPNLVAHCGLIINTGSRDEMDNEHGMAHFIEHMLFKGTKKRKAYHILSRLEDRGGELNAYTTKEETAVHASFLKADYDVAFELISDIVFNSVFPAKEIKKEKEVVMEEINSYKDSPSELIFDDFEEMIYANDSIGRNILGTPVTLKSFSTSGIKEFIDKNYHTDQMVICSVGNIADKKILKLLDKYFSQIPISDSPVERTAFTSYKPEYKALKKDTWQNHCIIGNIAYDLRDKRRIGMYLLNNILGGYGLNSRLNMSLREKNGFAYNVESNYNPYYDTGVFQIYFGTDGNNLDKSISIAKKELKKLREKKLGLVQLQKAKQQMKGNLARAYENHESYMLGLGKSMIVYNKVDPIEKIYQKISAITSNELIEIANEVFEDKQLSTLIYK